jgi:hypothetical protein
MKRRARAFKRECAVRAASCQNGRARQCTLRPVGTQRVGLVQEPASEERHFLGTRFSSILGPQIFRCQKKMFCNNFVCFSF